MKHKIGLVLSGGGAKGAYQTGLFRALEERSLAEQITVMAGTSIGAFDAAAYCVGGPALVRRLQHEFGAACRPETEEKTIREAEAEVRAGRVSLEQFTTEPRFRRWNASALQEQLRAFLPDAALYKLNRKVIVCAYSLEHARPEYFTLNGRDPQEQRDLILASGSLSFVFPPVKVCGGWYLDGGMIPPICPQGQSADKIPLGALQEEDVDRVLVNYLIASDQAQCPALQARAECLELRPSTPLEAYPGAGTLDFSSEKLREHEEKGLRDTRAFLASHWKFT